MPYLYDKNGSPRLRLKNYTTGETLKEDGGVRGGLPNKHALWQKVAEWNDEELKRCAPEFHAEIVKRGWWPNQ